MLVSFIKVLCFYFCKNSLSRVWIHIHNPVNVEKNVIVLI